jgi:4-aminobutyrate aminotransferase-like enzyme
MTVLDIIEDERLIENAAKVGGALKAALAERKPRCARIGDVRGHGLFIGIEMVKDGGDNSPDRAAAIDLVDRLKEKGFLTSNAGAFGNVVKIRPPLTFAMSDAEAFLEAFDATLADIDG